MAKELVIKPIAYIKNDMPEKFGIPRQSGLCSVISVIEFEPEYRDANAVRGIEEFSHLWLIWEFTHTQKGKWSPTVRPPRLGGNTRMGVFATRSPNRPNNLGLSLVKLIGIKNGNLIVTGADIMNGTPIYDIKPYLPAFEAINDAKGGFAGEFTDYRLDVIYDTKELEKLPFEKRSGLIDILSGDPRPSYQDDEERIYGMMYAGCEVKFKVKDKTLTIIEIFGV